MRVLSVICGAALSVLALSYARRVDAALIVPTFDSGPAVVSDTGQLDQSTVILALKNFSNGNKFQAIVRDARDSVWRIGPSELTSPTPLKYDSGPAAVRIGSSVLFCGHQEGSNTPIICGKGQPMISRPNDKVLFAVSVSPVPIPGGTFPAGMRPALVKTANDKVFLFGRGMDNQIWWNVMPNPSLWAWQGWTPVLTDFQGFSGAEPVVTLDSTGRIVLCARSQATSKPKCTMQTTAAGADPTSWTTWTFGPNFPTIFASMALTNTSAGLSLLGIEFSLPKRAVSSFNPGTWTSRVFIPGGDSFSGIGAASSKLSPNVIAVGRGGDNALWYNIGSSSGWGSAWTQIQAFN